MKKIGRTMALCLSIMAAANTGPAMAQQMRVTSQAGGDFPGGLFTGWCNSGEALVGIYGGSGAYVDSIGMVCARVSSSTGKWIGDTSIRQRFGGGGGNSYDLKCPRDQVVRGFRGRVGAFIDQIRIECRKLGGDGKVTGTSTWRGPKGGSGGSAFGPYRCPGSKPAFGLVGSASAFMHSLRLACRP